MKNTLKDLISAGKIISVTCFKGIADCDDKLYKTSSLRGRVTAVQTYTNCRVCEYENLAEVKEMRAAGIEAKKPTWWHWVDYPYFAQHNNRPTEYLVLKKADIHTQYYLDGVPINKSDYEAEFLKTTHKDMLVNMVKLADVVEVKGNHKVWQKQRRLAM